MFEHAEVHGHNFMVAFDRLAKDGRIVKMYASYPSSEDFVSNTLSKTENKHFYELIRAEKPCKLFLDIEWTGQDDPHKRVIHHVVDKLKAYTKVREQTFRSCANEEDLLHSWIEFMLQQFVF